MATIDIFKYETDVIDFKAGQHIFEEGEHGETMYVVQKGEVDVIIHGNIVETLEAGGVIGEMALLDHTFRSATAVARTDCTLVPLNEKKFLNHVNRTPLFALQVMRVIADRLRKMNTVCVP